MNRKIIYIGAVIVAIFAYIIFNNYSKETTESEEIATSEEPVIDEQVEEDVVVENVKWGYEGDGRPENWSSLVEEFENCGMQEGQSPINIDDNVINADIPDLVFDYTSQPLNIINSGYNIRVDYDGGTLNTGSDTYNVIQFHFHAPSENTVKGERFPMEMHVVHQNKAGELAVVGVKIKEGKKHEAMQPILDHVPAKPGQAKYNDVMINVTDLLPESKLYYLFTGSLTVPPCSPGVRWHVMKEPIELSAEQIKVITDLYPNNSRPLQNRGNRLIISDTQ